MDPLCVANTHFALGLFKKVIEGNENGNVFFSPFSISAALAMVCFGAGGVTAAQMRKVLHFDTVDNVHNKFKTLMSEINKPGTSYLLKLANNLYRDKMYTFLQEFQSCMMEFYQADLSAVDFANQSEVARNKINSWVERNTEGKILNLLSPGTITGLTKLVHVNVAYFKATWENEFSVFKTYVKAFRLSKSKSKRVNMMYQRGCFYTAHFSELHTNIVELPYRENELSMVILLPDNISDNSTGLEQLEQALTYEKLLDWTKRENMSKAMIKIHLPKFKLEDQYNLNSTLSAMGITDAFHDLEANFSGMTGKDDLVLSKVVHKSFVEVNEEGSEVTYTNKDYYETRSYYMGLPEIVADHPFLFFIRHNKSCNILFFGRFSSPVGAEVQNNVK